ncbi:Monocarboxylate transporter 12-like 4, partial [Homarus americanus]
MEKNATGKVVRHSDEHSEHETLLRCTQRLRTENINEVNQERLGNKNDETNIKKSCEKLTGDPWEEERSGQGSEAPTSHCYWAVAVGACIIMMMINMVGPCFSIVFSPLLLELGTSSTVIGWIFNIQTLLWFTCGLFLGPLVEEYSWRKVAMVWALVYFSSIVLSAFATSAWFLLFSFSILSGVSYGFLNTLCFLIIPHYFTRRRGVANACMMAGVCLGQMLGPILIGFLQEKFGFFGATLVLAAINVHCCVGASLFRPLQAKAKPSTSIQIDDPKVLSSDVDKIAKKRSCNISDSFIVRVCLNSVSNLSILKSPRAVIIAVGGMLTLNCWLNFFSLMPFAIQAAGHSLQTASLCMTTGAVCNLMARLTVSMLSDWPRFNMQACCTISSVILAGSIIAFSVVEDIKWQMVIMGVWGCGVGGYMGLFSSHGPSLM